MGGFQEDLTPDLPQCVAVAADAAEELYRVVNQTEFPDLPAELHEVSAAVEFVVDALQWAVRADGEGAEGQLRPLLGVLTALRLLMATRALRRP